jgi:putative N-acetylmannosamine-6-phosphate epimerase
MIIGMSKQKLSDHEQVFAVPVLESYPDLAPAYLNVVSLPMDLRTIEEERLNEYFAIKELQKDLVLIFRNCCTFNAEGSHFWFYAK